MSTSIEIVLDALTKSNSAALMIAVTGGFFVIFMKEYFRTFIRLKELRLKGFAIEAREPDDEVETPTPRPVAKEEKPANVVDFNFKLLERYYEQHLVEYKLMARSSLVVPFSASW